MFQHLLKAVTNTQSNAHTNTNDMKRLENGWGDPHSQNGQTEKRERLFKGEDNYAFTSKMRALGVNIQELESSNDKIGMDVNGSGEGSQKGSQVLSANDLGGEDCHPMILSNINNNPNNNLDHLSLLRIRNATSQLRQAYIDLSDYVELQKTIYQDFKEQLSQQFQNFAINFMHKCTKNEINQVNKQSSQRELRSKTLECHRLNKQLQQCKLQLEQEKSKGVITKLNSKPLIQQKNCNKCKTLQQQNHRIQNQLAQYEKQIQDLNIKNDNLQEYIFDIEQKIAGVDLEVERRLKEKLKTQKKMISPIKEDSKQIIDQLQSQIVILQQKCRRFENQSLQQSSLRQRERKLRQAELVLEQKDENLKDDLHHLQEMKEANYQRQHQILVAEENLSKKIADFRKKEAELSEWEAELTRKARDNRGQRDNTLANQFPSNQMSLQNSHEDLNQSGQISLKSFGKNNAILDHRLKGSPSQQQLDYAATYKIRTLQNYEQGEYANKRPHEFVHQRQNYPIRSFRDERQPPLKLEGKRYGESPYVSKPREHEMVTKKYNPQLSGYKDSREASPYRNINEPIKGRAYQYPPKTSPNHYRDISKNSRSSTSKSKLGKGQLSGKVLVQQQRDNQAGGLGFKLQRLREQIKKEIDSIK